MNKIFIFFICLLLGAQLLFAQKPLQFELKSKEKNVIYLSLTDKNELEYVVNKSVFDSKKSVNASDNSINIYLKWLNPLKYKLIWKDSSFVDERDKAISDFISALVAQFGPQISELGKTQISNAVTEPGRLTFRNFKNIDLVIWFLHIMENKTAIETDAGEVDMINLMTKKLEELDDLNSKNINAEATKIYTSLMEINDINQYNIVYPQHIAKISEMEDNKTGFGRIESLQKLIQDDFQMFTLSNNLLNTFSKATIIRFIETVTSNLKLNKMIVEKLKPILNIVKASTENESTDQTTRGYFKIKNAEFDDGKKLSSDLTITEFEFKKETNEFYKKREIINKSFVFQKFSIFDVTVNTGLFFANATLKGYGVSIKENSKFLVTEDNINKNTAVAAVLMNFNFRTDRYLSPLFQIGIDPSKKRPFMLFGIGVSIPSKRIAFSVGPIWTWEQTLDKLSIGQEITSTTELEKDIKYDFDMSPKGWYLGLQYNF